MNSKNQKKILLINPPWYRMLGGELVRFPLGLGYLAGILDKHGFDVSIYNADYKPGDSLLTLKRMEQSYYDYLATLNNLDHPLWQEVKDTISSHQPNIVGVSVMTAAYGSALNVAKIAKEIDSTTIVVFGGVHPTIMPEATLREVHRLLKPEGYCIISGESPDKSFAIREKVRFLPRLVVKAIRQIYPKFLIHRRWETVSIPSPKDMPTDINLFIPNKLEEMCRCIGFTNVNIRTNGFTSSIFGTSLRLPVVIMRILRCLDEFILSFFIPKSWFDSMTIYLEK